MSCSWLDQLEFVWVARVSYIRLSWLEWIEWLELATVAWVSFLGLGLNMMSVLALFLLKLLLL